MAHSENLFAVIALRNCEVPSTKMPIKLCTIIILYILNKSENDTLNLSIFCEKVLDKMYLLKLNNVFRTSSKRFVETLPICLVWCLSYAPPLSV